ncbi:tRNA lysidine(34) synthetase TilS [Sandaracinomonas limnophila]|uniref:tRNA(Ile)-lysidine synthase n=1 Tax=Sandaracinomonas limnophila TaxID=1862386 RepID=A0A437PXU2_9BACT|nr:tRNA lysidine(34) synthetase TilS [Sandaracinomonas limnophila]RVU27067.1 tRNA lysidine(34) synthetase TilS [Sandaracinomonas limnophila]
MLEDFNQFIEKHQLFTKEDKVLLAVSGGMDSMVMAKLFSLTSFSFGIAHVNFGLRGEESSADEQFVRKFAKSLKVPYHTITFETKAFAEKEKISIQQAARMLRYQWFEEIAHKENYQKIATAHHLMDSAETVILNLSRGTGIAGYHGIPISAGKIIRPLAFASQDQLFDIIVQYKMAWREDSSNQSTKYARNFIRHEIMPKLMELNPSIDQTIAENAKKIIDIENWIEAEYSEWLKNSVIPDNEESENIKDPQISSPKNKVLIAKYLAGKHFHFDQIEQIKEATKINAVGKIFESPTHVLNIDRNQWIIKLKNQQDFRPILIEEEMEEVQLSSQTINLYFEEKTEDFEIPNSPKIACLDAEKLEFPLEIRKYQEGDWFCPLGMNQKKLISDFLTDKKVPLLKKQETYVLLSKGSIVWVIGHRIDNRFKVTDKTEEVYILELIGKR